MIKAIKENCVNNIESDIQEKQWIDFSDDFTFYSNYNKISSYHKEGYLEKKCSNSWCGYKKRWFILKNKKLYYFKDKESLRPSGVLDLDLIHMNINYVNGLNRKKKMDDCFLYCIESIKYKNENKNESFLILNPKNTDIDFYLKGDDEEILEWYNLLNSSIDNKKILNQPKFIFSENNFWKIDRISVDVFEAIADTGDIVLFRSKVTSAKLQRIITGGEYDHIGMILRNDKNNLFLLEAISNMGIILTPWILFIKNKWNESYSRIALRRLTWNNSEENLQNLLEFLKNTIGKKYDLKIVNFLTSKNDEESGYFCSELIGECWKIMGVIPLNTSCSYILPSNFSEKFEGKIKLQSGCQLNNELCIDFSL
ncbi:conserved Plasmodium protein, unknown function [Plasmodium relictum]|uniref:PH domain-containing protein n=1 Tax=Plasmodium relictum TaxID=85471 RepID=A0A1J1H752_PLARL|nr:conserved Plasmodium protein, unknown function [Plasmodium relictum]CRH00745.1 conserved Plasmodium protein, unknown function [Plasmodium relictum]